MSTDLNNHDGRILNNNENCELGFSASDSLSEYKYLKLSCEVLKLLNNHSETSSLIDNIINAIQKYSGYDAIGIRIKCGQEFTFYCSEGFSDGFVRHQESLVCLDDRGNVLKDGDGKISLASMCGLVLSGGKKGCHFTEGGSFWVSDVDKFACKDNKESKHNNLLERCLGEGNKSFAIIPLHSNNDIVGVLMLNDKMPDKLNKEIVEFFENLASSISVALVLDKKNNEINQNKLEYSGLPDMLYKVDFEGSILFCSENVKEYFPMLAQAQDGKNLAFFQSICHQYKLLQGLIAETIKSKSIVEETIQIDSLKGKTKFYIRGIPEFDQHEKMTAVVVVMQDITNHSKIVQQCDEKAGLFFKAMDYIPTGIAIGSAPSGNIIYANAAVIGMGHNSANKSLSEIKLDDYSKEWTFTDLEGRPVSNDNLPLVRAIKYGEYCREKLCIVDRIGNDMVIEACAAPVKNDNDEIIAGIIAFSNITNLVRTASQLHEFQNKFSKLFHLSPDTIIISRYSDGMIVDANDTCEKMFGISRLNLIGNTAIDLNIWPSPEMRQKVFAPISSNLKVSDVLVKLKRASGEIFDAIIYAEGADFDGQRCIVSTVRDISERTMLNEKLKQNEKMSAIGQLVGGVAHDFNNQLTGILGYSDLLVKNLADPELKRYAENISTCALRSADLTDKLLAFSRKGAAKKILVNIHELIAEVIIMLERSIDKKITIIKQLHADVSTVTGDPSQLQNALLNLAINARDAVAGKIGEIQFTTQSVYLDKIYCKESTFEIEPGDYLSIEIADTGAGMDDEVLNKIFEPFFTTKDEGKGTGMGLAAVYGTVKQQHGAIEVRSAKGKGTVVKLLIPEIKNVLNRKTNRKQVKNKKGHILLVDDEEIVRVLGAQMLNDLGYEVTTCADGVEAVALFEKEYEKFDLIVLDMIMPEMGGRDTYLSMKRIDDDVKVIVASGYSDQGEMQDMLLLGAKSVMKKPFYLEDLSKIVEDVLAGV